MPHRRLATVPRTGLVLGLLAALILTAAPAGGEPATQRGLLLRDSELRAAPDATSAALTTLPRTTLVDVNERRGLWLHVSMRSPGEPASGWLRLTSLRLSQVPPDEAPASGGALAGFSRSLTSLFGGMRGRETRTAHATLGIRGLTAGEIRAAGFDAGALALVEGASASRDDAEVFARAGGLTAREVPELAGAMEARE